MSSWDSKRLLGSKTKPKFLPSLFISLGCGLFSEHAHSGAPTAVNHSATWGAGQAAGEFRAARTSREKHPRGPLMDRGGDQSEDAFAQPCTNRRPPFCRPLGLFKGARRSQRRTVAGRSGRVTCSSHGLPSGAQQRRQDAHPGPGHLEGRSTEGRGPPPAWVTPNGLRRVGLECGACRAHRGGAPPVGLGARVGMGAPGGDTPTGTRREGRKLSPKLCHQAPVAPQPHV